jgi:hypothetical protein
MIAATHSLQTREHHFEDVVSGGGRGRFDGTKKSVHICVQLEAAATSSDSHKVRQRYRKHAIVRNAASCCNAGETV